MTSLPLDLADVLAAEGYATHPEFNADIPFDVTPAEIIDAPALAERLTGSDEGKRIATLFTAEGRAFLEKWHERPIEDLVNLLAVELTRLLANPELFAVADAPLQKHTALHFTDPDAFVDDDLARANRALLDDVFAGILKPAMIRRRRAVFEAIHQGSPRSALCLSGGGIRSATFALGVVQALARRRLLEKFDFLSTVSGGGYIGGWLTAWIHRHRYGVEGVSCDLASGSRYGGGPDQDAAAEESLQIDHLRTYSNYLTPKLGAASLDTWTVFALVARNLFLNWLIIVPLLVTISVLPLLFTSLLLEHWTESPWLFRFGVFSLIVGIAYLNLERPSTSARDWPPLAFKFFCLLALILASGSLVLYWSAVACDVGAPDWRTNVFGQPVPLLAVLTGLGIFVNVSGWVVWIFTPRWRERPHRFVELIFAILAGAAGGALIYLLAAYVFPEPGNNAATVARYASSGVPLFLTVFFLSETLFAGGVSRWTTDADREWWARAAAWTMTFAVSWSIVVPIAIYGPGLLMRLPAILTGLGGLAGIVSVMIARSAKTSAIVKDAARSKRAFDVVLGISGPLFMATLLAAVSLATLNVISAVNSRLPLILQDRKPLDSVVTNLAIALITVCRPLTLALFAIVAFAIGVAISYFIDINKFSLHSMYRNRLIRAYLGASNQFRRPNRFTGFDEEDNLELASLRDPLYITRANVTDGPRLIERLRKADTNHDPLYACLRHQLQMETRDAVDRDDGSAASETIGLILDDVNRLMERRNLYQVVPTTDILRRPHSVERLRLRYVSHFGSLNRVLRENRQLIYEAFSDVFGPPQFVPKPMPIINTTLNLVGGARLAWQQRKAEPFSMTPLHCGSFRVGYRRADDYGTTASGDGKRSAISLGTAVAISGAAASPNMGYHSSPSATLLMTLFNARLGWWLGNPGLGGSDTHTQSHPDLALQPLIDEALGRTNDTNPYIYLSDGGHFENLGVYEAVLRRCHIIVATDASCDPDFKFDELGNAIRKIRIDLGIAIDFERGVPIGGQRGTSYCAIARIRYSSVDTNARDGALIYIKPVVYESSEPRDVMNYYEATNKVFPHESTSDQWFSESQFESYRALGSHMIETICNTRESEKLVDFAEWGYGHAYAAAERPGWLGDLRRIVTIRFEPARFDIVPTEQRDLERLAEILKRDPSARVSLVGRRLAEVESDEALAGRRANAVLIALTALGVADNRCEIRDGDTGNIAHRVDVFVLT